MSYRHYHELGLTFWYKNTVTCGWKYAYRIICSSYDNSIPSNSFLLYP